MDENGGLQLTIDVNQKCKQLIVNGQEFETDPESVIRQKTFLFYLFDGIR
ncbi:hypothetical protein [Succinivibrio dextrinosolvens]|nr:hypothetical protein [Succinivibrio dextrinosolvens]